jgi:hypothetical protein
MKEYIKFNTCRIIEDDDKMSSELGQPKGDAQGGMTPPPVHPFITCIRHRNDIH